MKISILKNFKYRVLPTDTESLIIKDFNTSKENIIRNNPNIPIYAGEWIEIKVNDFISHVVKPMETIETISKSYNVEKQDLIDFNSLTSEKLYIGQLIKIKKEAN